MAAFNLNQITDKLNEEFSGDVRKLIFWYDANGDFAGDVDALELHNAKVYHLQKDNQLRTKVFLEQEDTTTNYLIYAPFAKPDVRENHLADTVRYSKEFFADKVSLLMHDLGINENCRDIVQHYMPFFSGRNGGDTKESKQRTQAFYDLEISRYTRSSIEIGLMSVLCKCKIPSFEEVMRCVLTDGELEENALLAEFEKQDLLEPFWKHCALVFGYADEAPTLTKFVRMLFVTYADKCIHETLPQSWQPFLSIKSGTVIAFLDNLMNCVLYRARFDELSAQMYEALDGASQLRDIPVEAFVDCNLFPDADLRILSWMAERLVSENTDAKLSGKSIPQICAERRRMHFGGSFRDAYFVIENAWYIVKPGIYSHMEGIHALVKKYTTELYEIDRHYRYFYFYYDKLEDSAPFDALRSLVERIYTNDYLNPMLVDYADGLIKASGDTALLKQGSFYDTNVRRFKHQMVVIISDAMRYEVGVSLLERLQADEKCTAEISAMQGILPSVTRTGMAALLPHRKLTIVDGDHVLADDMPTIDLEQREAILKSAKPSSRAVQYDEIKPILSNRNALRAIFNDQEVVYIYHNQIDARGDKLATENEVFVACEEAVDEIAKLIRQLTNVNKRTFIVTADHGFLYKRDKLTGGDKIGGIPNAKDRYAITEEPVTESGVCAIPMKMASGVEDGRFVDVPKGSDLFRAPGSGKNYVHGGCSPQEMLVPVIMVKTEKGKQESRPVAIDLLSLLNKITNLITTLDLIQTEPVSDIVKEAEYRICFVSDTGEKISNENLFRADKKDTDAAKRIFRLRFSFKNRKYGTDHKYYLVVFDSNNREVLRREVILDLAFADDFGFGI